MRGALGTLVFLALFPPKVKNYNAMMRPIVDMFVDLAPRGSGVTLQEKVVHVALAWILNDTRGVPDCCCGKQAPAFVGSCVRCVIQGQRHHTATTLPGAVRQLPARHPLRAKYAQEFQTYEPIAMLAELQPCRKRLHRSIVASGQRVLDGATEQEEAFKGISEFVRLWYHDVGKHTIYDLAHALANMVKDTARYIMVPSPPPVPDFISHHNPRFHVHCRTTPRVGNSPLHVASTRQTPLDVSLTFGPRKNVSSRHRHGLPPRHGRLPWIGSRWSSATLHSGLKWRFCSSTAVG